MDKYLTPIGRFSFPALAEPNTNPEYGKNNYELTLLIPKDVFMAEASSLRAAVLECAKTNLKVGKTKSSPTKLKDFKHPFRDGDQLYEDKGYEAYKGCFVITAKSRYQPQVINASKNELNAKQIAQIKGGDYGRMLINVFPYQQQGGGVTFGLLLVQFWKEGPALGGINKAELIAEISELEVPLDEPDVDAEDDVEIEETLKPKSKAKTKTKIKKVVEEVTAEENEDDSDPYSLDDL